MFKLFERLLLDQIALADAKTEAFEIAQRHQHDLRAILRERAHRESRS